MTIIQLLLSLALLFLSVVSVFFWLLIPLMIQVIIDKVIVQNSPDPLNVLGLFLIVVTLVASASEIGLTTLTAFFIRNGLAKDKDIFLKLAATLPKVLAMLVVMAVYSLQLAFASTVLTALACGTYYLLKRGRLLAAKSRSEPLPLSFRLPLTLIVLFVLWYGTSFVLNGQLTLGQLIALSIFNIQFVSSLLSLVATTTKGRKRHEAVEPIQ